MLRLRSSFSISSRACSLRQQQQGCLVRTSAIVWRKRLMGQQASGFTTTSSNPTIQSEHNHGRNTTPPSGRKITSIGFSGAGFCTAYHLGVVHYLQQEAQSLIQISNETILTGVSGGSLAASALALDISARHGLNVLLETNEWVQTNCHYLLDFALQPGFSLVDRMEQVLTGLFLMASQQEDLFQSATFQRLWIGFTDSRIFPPLGYNPRAYRIMKSYRNPRDVVAACVLSSYIPGITGPLMTAATTRINAANQTNGLDNLATVRAQELINECILEKRLVDNDNNPLDPNNNNAKNVIFWDGGLVNMWPTVPPPPDSRPTMSIVVSPLAIQRQQQTFSTNKGHHHKTIVISPHKTTLPQWTEKQNNDSNHNMSSFETNPWLFAPINPHTSLRLCRNNLSTFRRIIGSSKEPQDLIDKFNEGYRDAAHCIASAVQAEESTTTTNHHAFQGPVDHSWNGATTTSNTTIQ